MVREKGVRFCLPRTSGHNRNTAPSRLWPPVVLSSPPRGPISRGSQVASRRVKIIKWFRSDHLPEGLPRAASQVIGQCARDLESFLPDNDQGDLAVILLLQAKDAAVRSVLDDEVPDYG